MLITLFPNLHKLATICLSIPIFTVSEEHSFSDMKLIKNRLLNCLTESSLSNLIKIVLNLPKISLTAIWKKLLCGIEKVNGLLCKLSFRLLYHYRCTLISLYICILSLPIHFVEHLSSMNFNSTISKGGGGKKISILLPPK